MTAEIIEGKAIAAGIRGELRDRVERLAKLTVRPGLAVVLVGNNPASESYVRGKTQAAQELGLAGETIRLAADSTQEHVLGLVADLNADPRYHGILVQLPLPGGLDERATVEAIHPEKDVDGLHPVNMGRLLRGEPGPRPCTPLGVQQMLVRSGHSPEGKRVAIVGRGILVGKPLAAILMQKAPGADATVTVCHSRTPDLPAALRSADIVVAAIGVACFVTADMVRPGAVVVDVGINRVADPSRKSGYRIVGDVDFETVREVASAITPVPGGVGPLTVTMLLVNTVAAAERAVGLHA